MNGLLRPYRNIWNNIPTNPHEMRLPALQSCLMSLIHPTFGLIRDIVYYLLFLYVRFHLSSMAEFRMTTTEPALWTRAPTTGPRIPVIARAMARKFNPMEKMRLR